MFEIHKAQDAALEDIPFGIVEAVFPDRAAWNTMDFYGMADGRLEALKAVYAAYERQEVFGSNPYYRFFKKFRRIYPVMMRFDN